MREKGLWQVRISDVARRAGISPAGVVYYFGGKEELFAQAIAGADDAFYESVARELGQRERAVERLACLIVRSSTTDWLLWMDLWLYARWHPEIAGAQRRFSRRWRHAFAEVVRYGESRGEWEAADPDGVAQRMAALTDGLAVHMVLGDPDHSRERYVEMAVTGAALELGVDVDELRAAAAACPVA